MTQEEYLKRFEEKCQAEIELTRKKNADYAGVENAFKNFELIEYLTAGRITAAEGLLVRMSDKLIRFANLLSRPAQVKDEKITDTLDDLSVYSKICSIVLEEKQEPEQMENPNWALRQAQAAQNMYGIGAQAQTMRPNPAFQAPVTDTVNANQPNFFIEMLRKMQGAQ